MISERSINILEAFRDVTQEKNIANIYLAVINSLPKIFKARQAGFFFIDQADGKLM
jgi:hypothetical protein